MIITFYGAVQEYTQGEKSFEPDEPCATLRSLIPVLLKRYGDPFKEAVDNERFFFLVNGRAAALSGGLNTSLKQGDKIEVIPRIEAG